MNNNQDPGRPQRGYIPYGEPEIKRTYTPEEAGHDRNRKPVTRVSYNSRRRKRKSINAGVVIIVLAFVFIACLCIYLILSGKSTPTPPENAPETDEKAGLVVETNPPETDENGEEQKEPETPLEYITITLSAEDVYSGDLVLVNAYHEYHFPADMEGNIVANAEHKNEHFGLSAVYPTSKSMSSVALEAFNRLTEEWYLETGFESLQVNSAYRDYEDQDILYTNSVRDNGIDYTVAYVANPGYSEHHTGLGIDLNVNRNGAISYVGTDPECAWFRDGCKDYGFILRYPGDKIDITGIGHETWHYRYVGVPHAQIMVDQNLCLEEYIDYVKDYTYEETCLGYSEETGVYEITADEYYEKGGTMIYYVPATGEDVEVCIPRNCEYKVSGNNVDGYIITCTDK